MPSNIEQGQPRRRPCRVAVGAALLAALTLGACKPKVEEGYYDVAPDAAYARVLRADIKGFRDARHCGMLIYFSTDTKPGRSIAWTVTSGNTYVAKFAVGFTARDKGTVISIGVPKGPNGEEIYNGRQTYAHPAIMQPLRPAVRELIDAAIEGRPYNWRYIPAPLNTDELCSMMHSSLTDYGTPYSINDPSGMHPYEAEKFRRQGVPLRVERDRYFEGQ